LRITLPRPSTNVLHHPPAIADHPAPAVDEAHAQQAVAAGARMADPTRPGHVPGHHATDRRRPVGAQQRPVIHRFEGQGLALGRQHRLDFGHRRARAHHQGQGARFVIDDARQPAGFQHLAGDR